MLIGAFNTMFCGRTPSNTHGVINVGGIQQAVDDRYPGMLLIIQ